MTFLDAKLPPTVVLPKNFTVVASLNTSAFEPPFIIPSLDMLPEFSIKRPFFDIEVVNPLPLDIMSNGSYADQNKLL